MERNLLQELKVGAFVLAFAALIVVTAFVLGGGTEAFARRYTLHARYADVKGLKPGAVVRLAGIDVGEVKVVELAPKTEDGKNVHVVLSIREEYHDNIRSDSVAGISNVGVLGDNIITITVGGETAAPLADNGAIGSAEALDFVDYADRATAIVDNTASVSHKFDLMLGSEEEAKGAKIADSLSHVEAMLAEAKTGKGVLNVLIYDQGAGRKVRDILANAELVTADVADMTREVREGMGSRTSWCTAKAAPIWRRSSPPSPRRPPASWPTSRRSPRCSTACSTSPRTPRSSTTSAAPWMA